MNKAIDSTSKILIRELAEFIALEHADTITPLDKIAQSEEIQVFYDDYEDYFDGLLVYESLFFIHINTRRGNKPNSQRGRFTLAHELGHYFIDNHRLGLVSGILGPHGSFSHRSSDEKIEKEADYFASCLLMPSERFSKDCIGRKFDFSIIEELSEKYCVSLTACAIRFADVGNHPILIVYCEDNQIIWRWSSDDFPYWNLRNGNRNIPTDSLVSEYFVTGKVESGTEQLWVGDWFKCYNYEDEGKILYEHFIPYRNKGLSIIWEE